MAEPTPPGASEKEAASLIVLEKWGGLDTKSSRVAIGDNDFSYCMNFFPNGDGNLRTLPGEGANLYAASGKTVIYVYPFNISTTQYQAIFLSDGSAVQVKVSDGTVTTIAGAGTFGSSSSLPSCAQHGADSIIIVSMTAANGYWIWNGSFLKGAGTLGDVTLTSTGLNASYSSTPTVTAYGGTGTGATFTPTVANNIVTQLTMANPGSGWLLNEQVVLAFSGGGSDSGAAATATITQTSGGISSIQVTAGGTGYTSASVITFAGGGASTTAQAVISSLANGVIVSILVTNPGVGYTSQPTVTITVGAGATVTCIITRGQVTACTVATGGTNYKTPPVVTILGDGVGATAHATLAAGVVNAIVMDTDGYGYSYAKVLLTGGNNAAQAVVNLMPFGLNGNSVETYQQRVWVTAQTKYILSAPGSMSDFSSGDGGAAVPISDSFTKSQITAFRQNNYLYKICDSSVNVISNVQTGGNPSLTTFNDQNVDPQVGSFWPNSVVAFGRATMFANPTGIYALYGGAAQKVSGPLDGLFANASFNTGATGITPSACVFDLYSIKIFGFLFTTIDPYTKQSANILACWTGEKWFLASQVKTLTLVWTQEFNSVLTAYGTDGTNVFPLFQTATASLTKTIQTKLSPLNALMWIKQCNRIYALVQSNDGNSPSISLAIDTENGPGALAAATVATASLVFTGADGNPLVFLGSGSQPINWTVTSIAPYASKTSAYGTLIGETLTTSATDMTLVNLSVEYAPKYALRA